MRSSLVVAIAALALIGLFSQGFATNISSKARYIGSSSVPRVNANSGGFSGISVNASGYDFLALTDRGRFFSGQIERENEVIQSVELKRSAPLLNPKGNPIADTQNDSEGLAVRSDGRIFVSFEGPARVWTYRNTVSEAAQIPRHPNFKKLHPNKALEALAIAPDGALFSLVEGSSKQSKPHPVLRYEAGKWELFTTIPRRGSYLPVGADFGPDGKFYLLERRFSALSGFQTRVRRFDVGGADFKREEIILESAFGDHGNLEGLSIWQDAADNTRLTMISDDNFRFFLPSEIVEYSLTE